jgi:hypothetical protein
MFWVMNLQQQEFCFLVEVRDHYPVKDGRCFDPHEKEDAEVENYDKCHAANPKAVLYHDLTNSLLHLESCNDEE